MIENQPVRQSLFLSSKSLAAVLSVTIPLRDRPEHALRFFPLIVDETAILSSVISTPVLGPVAMPGSNLAYAEVAHDLSNAISAIRLQLDLFTDDLSLSDKHVVARIRRRLRAVQPAVQHAADIARQLLDPANLHEKCADAQPTSLNLVLRRMVPISSAMLQPRVVLRLQLAPDLDGVDIDPVQVVRIVSNLVLNSCAALARDVSVAGGQVTLETVGAKTTGWVVLRVRDTGPGISAATQASLVRPFFATKPRGGGLGLDSVLRMVRSAGGTVRLNSAAGEGTTITIDFPCAGLRNKKMPQRSRLVPPSAVDARKATSKSGPKSCSR